MTSTETPIEFPGGALEPGAFAARLANLLRARRQADGVRLATLARQSHGRFTARDLRDVEAGRGDPHDAVELAELYGADLAAILPERLPLEIDPSGRISTAGVVEDFGPEDQTSLLIAYLRLVRRLRHQERAEVIVLRHADVDVLASTLQMPGEAVVDRLGALMGATRVQRRVMVGMFVAGAAIIGLTVSTVAATSNDGATDAVTEPPVPVETLPAETEPVETLPAETEPVETEPTTTVPVETVAEPDIRFAALGFEPSLRLTVAWPSLPDADAPVAEPTPTTPATAAPAPPPAPTTTEPEIDTGTPPVPPPAPPPIPEPPEDDVVIETGPPPVPVDPAPIPEPPPPDD